MKLLPETLILISVCRLTHKIILYIKPVPEPLHHVQLMSQVWNFEKVTEQSKQQQEATAKAKEGPGHCIVAVTAAAFHLALGWNMEQQGQNILNKSWAHSHLIPAMERTGAYTLGQRSLSLWVWNWDWSSAPHSAVCLFHHWGFRSLHCMCHSPPSETRAVFVLTCVLLVPGGCTTASQDKGVERGSEPVAFIEHMGKAVLSAVTCTKETPSCLLAKELMCFCG